MRFDLSQKKTAYQVVNQYPEEKLTEVISQYGEEPRARKVARAIVNSRPIETTTQLAGHPHPHSGWAHAGEPSTPQLAPFRR